MEFFNSLTRKKEKFTPIKDGKVGVYICGPTVYNFMHIGNARVYVVFDVLRRYLQYRGFETLFVQNFTDIDDRIIARSNEEGVSAAEIAQKYINEFFIDAEGLEIGRVNYYPRVTEEMPEIIEIISLLISKGFAYEKSGTVYFRTSKSPQYGKLSNRNPEEQQAGSRIEINPEKENSADFVLWKAAKSNEPGWDSPWGLGRPGWHIECSAMAKKYVGNTLDIHCGGEDLLFPHHENEIAQSEAANDAPLANLWLHNGMLLVDNKKMSKSEGNFFLIREIAEKFSYSIIRFFILSAHYRSPLNFSFELMESAKNGLDRIRNCRRNILENLKNTGESDSEISHLEEFEKEFFKHLDDDLNTANAISTIFDLVKFINKNIDQGSIFLKKSLEIFDFIMNILGINVDEMDGLETEEAEIEIERLIAERDAAKKDKNWEYADQIRNQLFKMGIIIKDTLEGTKWHWSN
ncbi:MAG: cysteine--tRNA ligase [Defluviitaleaceae bacterium]|nr:cysteine--tRNA ligase [Defluviitaleaceae bacterium]